LLEEARQLIRGDFLDDCPFYGDSEYIEESRRLIRGRQVDLLVTLGERHEARGDRPAAATAFREALVAAGGDCVSASDGLARLGVYGWAYEAINYPMADDARIRADNRDMTDCASQGVKAGDEVVTSDGIHVAGWYIPAADGASATAATIVLVHGYGQNKTGILHYAPGLHQRFNLVAFDERNGGRSTGSQTTLGVLEQKDVRAMIDWVERVKHP